MRYTVLLEFLITLGILPGRVWSAPMARVSGLWAGVDSVWEQEKLEARKMLENAQTPTRQVHALLLECSRKGRGGVS